ncbi:MAG: endonuclease/exonuclease/phosphatase family protein [Flavicella sp.]
MKNIQISLLFISISILFSCQNITTKKSNTQLKDQKLTIHNLAFYNVENLFDTINDPNTLDEKSPILEIKNGRSAVYREKVKNMANVIAGIGKDKTGSSPTLIGLAEIENETVLKDLIESDSLKNEKYGYIHFDSQDARGIDVALLYKKEHFIPIDFRKKALRLSTETGEKYFSRDQLVITGYLEEERIHLIVNHWPSRRGGEEKSSHLRESAAYLTTTICDSILANEADAKIGILGDFNDNPKNASFKSVLKTKNTKEALNSKDIYNPYEALFEKGHHTLVYRDNLFLFDQVLISKGFLTKENTYDSLSFYSAHVHNPSFLTQATGRYKNYPFRSFVRNGFTGGYSDHYPVYISLVKKKK